MDFLYLSYQVVNLGILQIWRAVVDGREMVEARMVRLEYILLGAALASSGDREMITDSMGDHAWGSSVVSGAMGAIRSKDRGLLSGVLSPWVPIKENERVIPAVLRRVKRYDEERLVAERVKQTLEKLNLCMSMEEIRSTLALLLEDATEFCKREHERPNDRIDSPLTPEAAQAGE